MRFRTNIHVGILSFFLLVFSGNRPVSDVPAPEARVVSLTEVEQVMAEREEAKKQDLTYKINADHVLGIPEINEAHIELVLEVIGRLQEVDKSHEAGNLSFDTHDLIEVLSTLYQYRSKNGVQWNELVDFYRISGKRNTGKVHFTGYYSPVIKVKRKPNRLYKYPIYRLPTSMRDSLPSRSEIDKCGALKDMNLEIAYANNPVDIYFTQLQGSGVIQYDDDTKLFLAFAGANKYRFKNLNPQLKEAGIPWYKLNKTALKIQHRQTPAMIDSILLHNDSYTFFKTRRSEPYGALGNQLLPMASIAVDPDYIPLGSVLLSAFPEVDEKGKQHGFSFQLLFANDVGGAIKGPGHVDVYTGIGDEGESLARRLNHYGALWLIQPKSPLMAKL